MKKYIIPALLAVTVFVVTIYFQRFTILRQEGLGLFLNVPDVYRAMLFDPFPLSNLIGSFLVQFYASIYAGAAIVASIVVIEYYVIEAVIERFGFDDMGIAAMAGACVSWFFLSKASNPSTGVAIILCSLAIYAVLSMVVRKKVVRLNSHTLIGISACIGLLVAASLTIIFNKSIREGEKWGKIEFAAVQGEWNYLLKVATPEEAYRDMRVVPYALMALNAQDRLATEMGKYPISDKFGLDYAGELNYGNCLFDAVLFSNLHCPNEAVHRIFQCGDFLPHGTSFRTLRMLVKENHAMGDSLMVVKYCDVLDHSLTHREFTRYYKNHPCRQRVPDSPEESAGAPLIVSSNPLKNMIQLINSDICFSMVLERYYAYYQLNEFLRTHPQGK